MVGTYPGVHTMCFTPFSCIVNSLTPGRCGSDFQRVIFKLIMQNSSLGTHCEIALRWMPQSLINKKSTTQHWFRLWLGAVREQVITWANVYPDLCHHMVSLGHSELNLTIIGQDDVSVLHHPAIYRDHFVYVPSQWETTLHFNVVFHWLGAYTKWSLHIPIENTW